MNNDLLLVLDCLNSTYAYKREGERKRERGGGGGMRDCVCMKWNVFVFLK